MTQVTFKKAKKNSKGSVRDSHCGVFRLTRTELPEGSSYCLEIIGNDGSVLSKSANGDVESYAEGVRTASEFASDPAKYFKHRKNIIQRIQSAWPRAESTPSLSTNTVRIDGSDGYPIEITWPNGNHLRLRWDKNFGLVRCSSDTQLTITPHGANTILLKAT